MDPTMHVMTMSQSWDIKPPLQTSSALTPITVAELELNVTHRGFILEGTVPRLFYTSLFGFKV